MSRKFRFVNRCACCGEEFIDRVPLNYSVIDILLLSGQYITRLCLPCFKDSVDSIRREAE